MRVCLGIIPARGGSKGILKKNIKPLNDKGLILYAINCAIESKHITHYVISTDCENIKKYCTNHDISIPSLRPEHLSTDTAKTIDVVIYEVLKFEQEHNCTVDDVILIQPTSPLRTSQDIDRAYDVYKLKNSSSLISCYNAESVHPRIMYTNKNGILSLYLKENNEIIRRQDMEPIYIRNGAIYITKRDEIIYNKRLICTKPALYEMSREASINIDSPLDLKLAEFYMNKEN